MENKLKTPRGDLIKEIFDVFQKHHADPLEILTMTTLFAGQIASSLDMKKEFFLSVCEKAFEPEVKSRSGMLQ